MRTSATGCTSRIIAEASSPLLNKGRPGEVYNIGGNNEITNRVITETILREMGKNWDDVAPSKTAPATTADIH